MDTRTTLSVLLLFIALFIDIIQPGETAARTIKVPLTGVLTQNSGIFGQPVISYYAPINVGTPSKLFNVQFDIELFNDWLPHYEWNPFKINLHYNKGFQCKVSSTCVKKQQLYYTFEHQQCKLTGKLYNDNIVLASIPPVSLRQNFLAISDASNARFKNLPIDGFFGLSPGPSTNILTNLHYAGLIDNMQFSLWFNKILDSAQGGELVLGGVDESRYQGQIYWHNNATMNNLWSLNLQYVNLGGKVVSCYGKQCYAIISSGVNEIYGPSADVENIYASLITVNSSNLPFIDCRRIPSLPTLTFVIDGIHYNLLPTNYIRKVSWGIFQNETCYVAIMPSYDNQQRWILGTNFLGAYYSIYDMTYHQVGFAAIR